MSSTACSFQFPNTTSCLFMFTFNLLFALFREKTKTIQKYQVFNMPTKWSNTSRFVSFVFSSRQPHKFIVGFCIFSIFFYSLVNSKIGVAFKAGIKRRLCKYLKFWKKHKSVFMFVWLNEPRTMKSWWLAWMRWNDCKVFAYNLLLFINVK